jgi:hypothetical protein
MAKFPAKLSKILLGIKNVNITKKSKKGVLDFFLDNLVENSTIKYSIIYGKICHKTFIICLRPRNS